MDDLRKSLPPLREEATPADTLLIIPRMKYGGHAFEKIPTTERGGVTRQSDGLVQNWMTRAMHLHANTSWKFK